MVPEAIQVLLPALAAFVIGMAITPVVSHYLYSYRAWKKRAGKTALDGSQAQEFNRLHSDSEVRAPRMGGIIIWASAAITIVLFALLADMFADTALASLNFLSRNQTWVPLAALLIGALAGLLDDLLVIKPGGEGLPLSLRLGLVIVLSGIIGWWFFDKLEVTTVNVPFGDPITLGFFIVPFFIAVSLGLFASGVIDGIDGLSGGVFMSIFASYALIAYVQNQIDIAALCAALVGGILAFLWFNIPPARFYMSDTGTMALTLCLAVIVFMTDSLGGGYGIAAFPIIGALLIITVFSNVAQVLSKRYLGKKLLRVAPLHHHFEAIGWPGYKVVMRYWVLSIVFAFLGVIFALSAL